MKTKILRKTVVSGFVLLGLAMLLTAGTRDGKGLVRAGNALPANIIVVTNTKDSGPGSLRDALALANDGDTIDATGISGTILLTSGELQITHKVTINGPGAGSLAVNGNATSRVFENFGSNVTISGFTITNGNGGGIFNNLGGLTLSDSSVVSNVDGAIFNVGNSFDTVTTLTITNSVISGNSSAVDGGGIINAGSGGIATLTVSNCTISGNSAAGNGGGGILNVSGGKFGGAAIAMVSNSTLSGNSAGVGYNGGGIYNMGGFHSHTSLFVNSCTMSGNSAPGAGGAIMNSGAATISDTVLNAGASGGTIFNDSVGTVTSLGYNVASDNGGGVLTGPGDQINTDPMLGPLQDNGGPTLTHALLPGSPAIGAGNPNFTPPPIYDQRGPGFDRVVNGRIDKGSFEVQSGGTPTPTPTPTATPTTRPTPTPRATPTPKPRPSPPPAPANIAATENVFVCLDET